MKLEVCGEKKEKFQTIEESEIFLYSDGEYYMKIPLYKQLINAVNVRTGHLISVGMSEKVQPVKTTLNIWK